MSFPPDPLKIKRDPLPGKWIRGEPDPLQEARRLSEQQSPMNKHLWFIQARPLLSALAQRVEDAERENERLRRTLGAIADIPSSPHYDMCSKTARQALRQEEE